MGIFSGIGKIAGLSMKGPAGRAVLGAGIGGVMGAAQGYQNPNNSFESIMKGMALGAVGGSVFTKIPGLATRGIGSIAKGKLHSFTPVGRVGGLAKGITKLAWRNPKTIAAIGAVGYAATQFNYGEMGSSPSMSGARVNTDYNRQAIAMEQMTMGGPIGMGSVGTAPQMMNRYRRNLRESTQGLVQGLNRGRHS